MGKRTSPDQRLLEKVRAHPESVEIEIGGETFTFLLCGLGAKRAREAGHDPIPPIFSTLEKLVPALMSTGLFADGKPTMESFDTAALFAVLKQVVGGDFLDNLIVIIWWGLLAAHPDTELDDVYVLVTPSQIKRIVETVLPRMMTYAQDIEPDEETSDDSSGGPSGN